MHVAEGSKKAIGLNPSTHTINKDSLLRYRKVSESLYLVLQIISQSKNLLSAYIGRLRFISMDLKDDASVENQVIREFDAGIIDLTELMTQFEKSFCLFEKVIARYLKMGDLISKLKADYDHKWAVESIPNYVRKQICDVIWKLEEKISLMEDSVLAGDYSSAIEPARLVVESCRCLLASIQFYYSTSFNALINLEESELKKFDTNLMQLSEYVENMSNRVNKNTPTKAVIHNQTRANHVLDESNSIKNKVKNTETTRSVVSLCKARDQRKGLKEFMRGLSLDSGSRNGASSVSQDELISRRTLELETSIYAAALAVPGGNNSRSKSTYKETTRDVSLISTDEGPMSTFFANNSSVGEPNSMLDGAAASQGASQTEVHRM